MGFGDIAFGGLAALYGALASLGIVGLLRLCGSDRTWWFFPFYFITLSFLFLTQHPFPAPGTLNCPIYTATPQLQPLRFGDALARLERRDATVLEYLSNRALVATAMNFLVCAAIGVALVRHVTAWRWIVLFGATLTLAAELTQLTGIWWLYPCAYRQFNVDDLLLNALGVISGAVLAKAWLRLR